MTVEEKTKYNNRKVKLLKLIEVLETYYLFKYEMDLDLVQKDIFMERVKEIQTIIDRKPLRIEEDEIEVLNNAYKSYRVSQLQLCIYNAPLNEKRPYKNNIWFKLYTDAGNFAYEITHPNGNTEVQGGFKTLENALLNLHEEIYIIANNLQNNVIDDTDED